MIHFRLAHLDILRSVGEVEAPDADCREVDAVDVYYDEETFTEAKRLLKVYKAEMPEEAEPYECTEGDHARTVSTTWVSGHVSGCIEVLNIYHDRNILFRRRLWVVLQRVLVQFILIYL